MSTVTFLNLGEHEVEEVGLWLSIHKGETEWGHPLLEAEWTGAHEIHGFLVLSQDFLGGVEERVKGVLLLYAEKEQIPVLGDCVNDLLTVL